MLCIFQRATVPGKWLRPNHGRYIPRPTGSVLSTQEIFDSSVHYPVVYHHLESSPYAKAGLICYAWFKELLYEENGCVPITYGTYQTHRVCPIHTKNIGPIGPISSIIPSPWIESLPKGRSHMLCIFQRATVPGKWLSQSRTVHSKTHRVCPNHTRNIGLIGPLSSSIPSPWIESLTKGRSHMPCIIQRATVPGKWLRPNHVRYIPRPTGSVLST